MTVTRSRAMRAAMLATLGGATLMLSAATSSSSSAWFKGGPWISIETPANPYDVSTRGSVFVVHTFHHAVPTDMVLEGRAEGLVDGDRRTVPLTLSKGSQTGAYGVRNQWGTKGTWSVLLTATQPAPKVSIQAVVDLGADGTVSRVSMPQRMQTTADIDRSLRARANAALTVGAR
jgi:hypothetical protein